MKYNKHFSKTIKIIIYIIIAAFVIGLNIALTCLSFKNDSDNHIANIILAIITFILETGGLIYFIVQDILASIKSVRYFKQMDEDSIGRQNLPFIDRTTLINEVVTKSISKIENEEFYYEIFIKYGEQNGKYSFAHRLANEFEWLRDKTGKPISQISNKQSKKLGCIYFVDYSKHNQNFEEYVKSLYYIKNKKNIVIVNNYFSTVDYWTDSLKDNDIFFIKLNYIAKADDKLIFPDDKIKELLKELSNMPKYENKLSKVDFESLSIKLGQLSGNNIGNLIRILDSDEFEILIETDNLFLDFYFDLKNAKYAEAKEKYDNIKILNGTNNIYSYKLRYERANLNHFLGEYQSSFNDLEILDSELCNDNNTFGNFLGRKLHFDIIILQSHIQKHMGNFEEAKNILYNVNDEFRNLIWMRSNFAVDIFSLNALDNSSLQWYNLLKSCLGNMRKFNDLRNNKSKDSNYYFYEAYYPIAAFYESNFDLHIIGELINIEDDAINFYESHERRFLTNCLFIKAEFLRINGDFKKAKEYYERCYQVYLRNGDKDILFLIAITEKYISTFYKINLQITKDLDKVIEQCQKEAGYAFHNHLITDLMEASLDENRLNNLKRHFENTINPIP